MEPKRIYCYHFRGYIPVDSYNSSQAFYKARGEVLDIYVGVRHPKHDSVAYSQDYIEKAQISSDNKKDEYIGSRVTYPQNRGMYYVELCGAIEPNICGAGVDISVFDNLPCIIGSTTYCASMATKYEEVESDF